MRCPWKLRKGKKLTGCYQTEAAAKRAARTGWRPVFSRPPGVPLTGSKKKDVLDLQVVRSRSNPCAVRLKISGKVGRIAVRGKTTTVFIGLDDVDKPGFARRVTIASRAEGGGDLPFATQRKVEGAVARKLRDLDC